MTAENAHQEITILTKMSTRTIGAKPTRVVDQKEDKPLPLYHVYGKARGTKLKEGNDGQMTTAILGNFEAVNLDGGEVFRSGVLYLPAGISDILETAVAKLKDDADSVDFALEICATKAQNKIGYSYVARPLLKPQASDDLSQLRELISAARPKQLTGAAPKK